MKKRVAFALTAVLAVSLLAGCSHKNQDETTVTTEFPAAAEFETNEAGDIIAGDIRISTEEIKGESAEGDKDYNYSYSLKKPAVYASAASEAANDKIQAAIDGYYDIDMIYIESGDFGLIATDYPDQATYLNVDFYIMRADAEVISIMLKETAFHAGEPGESVNISYLNFYTETGDRVTFESISPDFREKAFELVRKEADKIYIHDGRPLYNNYSKNIPYVVMDGTEIIWEYYNHYNPGSISDEWIEKHGDILADPTFGLTETGYIFTSNGYTLSPDDAGILHFEIAAEDFE